MINPPIYEIRVIKRKFGSAIDDVISGFDAEHETVVLVPDFVAPGAEAAAGEDGFFIEGGEEGLQHGFAREGWGGVAVVEAAVVGGDDFVGGAEHFCGDEAFDAVGEKVFVVDGLHGGFGDFEHDGPVGTFLGVGCGGLLAGGEVERGELFGVGGLIVWGVVGEDGGAVEGAVVFWEIEPAFIADTFGALATDTDADNVSGGVE